MAAPRRPVARGHPATRVEDSPGDVGTCGTASEQVMSLGLKMIRLSGLWPTKKSGVHLLVTVLTIAGLPMLLLTAASYFLVPREVDYEAFDTACCGATLVPALFNVVLLLCRKDQFEEYVWKLKSFAERTTCRRTLECLSNLVATEKKVTVPYLVIVSAGFFTRIILPVAIYYKDHLHANSTVKMGLPIGMYPLGEEENRVLFAALFVFQAMSLTLTFVAFAGVEIFVYTLIVHTANQFEVLKILIRDIESGDWLRESAEGIRLQSLPERKRAGLKEFDVVETCSGDAGVRNEMPMVHIKGKPESEKNEVFSCFWKKFSAFHQEALRNADTLCELLRTLLFLHYALTSLILCSLLYQIIVREEIFERVHMCSYLGVILTRLFILSILPTILTTKSAAVCEAVAASQWYHYSSEVKSTLVIIMGRAQRPVYLWAGRFAIMSLETYAAMLQASFSYYSILKKIA